MTIDIEFMHVNICYGELKLVLTSYTLKRNSHQFTVLRKILFIYFTNDKVETHPYVFNDY